MARFMLRLFVLRILPCVGLFGISTFVGCSSPPPTSTEVSGVVYFRETPLEGGTIVFVPDDERGNSGGFIQGKIESDGTFKLTNTEDAPFRSGWYRVAVAPLPDAHPLIPTAENPYPGPANRFRNPKQSGLECQVKAGTTMTNVTFYVTEQ